MLSNILPANTLPHHPLSLLAPVKNTSYKHVLQKYPIRLRKDGSWINYFYFFSKLKKLKLIFVTKKSYKIYLPFHLIIFSLVIFHYILLFILAYSLTLAEHCLHCSSFTSSKMLLSMMTLTNTDAFLHALEKGMWFK